MQTQNVVTDKEREIRKRDLEDKDRKTPQSVDRSKKPKLHPSIPFRLEASQRAFQEESGAAELYSMLAENIDGSCGAVVADQTHLASLLGVGRQTISRYVMARRARCFSKNPSSWKGMRLCSQPA